ncbi:MAG: SgcJ/EcaC family oxidoreductase [Chloroflexota bacterium]
MQSTEQTIRDTFSQWTTAWNAGDIDGYLVCYAPTENVTYIGSGKIIRGQDAIANHFRQRFPSSETMGQLTIKSLEVNLLGAGHAQLLGIFEHQINDAQSRGIFTLYLKNINDTWYIVVDHSSALN